MVGNIRDKDEVATNDLILQLVQNVHLQIGKKQHLNCILASVDHCLLPKIDLKVRIEKDYRQILAFHIITEMALSLLFQDLSNS